jgi:hypothetical protein
MKVNNNLIYVPFLGLAFQKEKDINVPYDVEYFEKLKGYENTEIGRKLNDGRVKIVYESIFNHLDTPFCTLLDFGCGACTFLTRMKNSATTIKQLRNIRLFGYDINTYSRDELDNLQIIYFNPFYDTNRDELRFINIFTFFDTIEHLAEPWHIFDLIPDGAIVIVSIPIFKDISVDGIKSSKHYRPNEHFWYFTERGFKSFMAYHKLMCLGVYNYEIQAGREDIYTFVFKKIN